MRTTWTKACLAVAAVAVCCLATQTRADETTKAPSPEEMMKAMAEAGTPGPEHEKLKALEGDWDYTCKFWMDPSQPPMETTGTIERHWILGGRFLEEKVKGTDMTGKAGGFEGFGLLGYDKGQGKYTMAWACNMGTGVSNGTGTADASGKEFKFASECFCPLRKQVIKGRDEVRIKGDKAIMESFIKEDGKEVKVMEIVAVRKK